MDDSEALVIGSRIVLPAEDGTPLLVMDAKGIHFPHPERLDAGGLSLMKRMQEGGLTEP